MTTPSVRAVLEFIDQRRTAAVIDLVRSTAQRMGDEAALDLLVAVQVEAGRRWQDGSWSIADEHAATAIVDRALTALDLDEPREQLNGDVLIVACPEGEWHVLPARIVAHGLVRRGWQVEFLGASLPDDHLQRYLEHNRALALVLSCSMALHLPGSMWSIAAAHRAATPVLVGGAAFGPDARLAGVIGADGWCRTNDQADETLRDWAATAPQLSRSSADIDGHDALRAVGETVVRSIIDVLPARYPPALDHSQRRRQRVQDELGALFGHLETGVLTGDPGIFTGYLDWLSVCHQAHGEPAGLARLWLELLKDQLPPVARGVAREVLEAADAAAR